MSGSTTPMASVTPSTTPQQHAFDRLPKGRSIRERRGSMKRVGSLPEAHSREGISPMPSPREKKEPTTSHMSSIFRIDSHMSSRPAEWPAVNDGGAQWLERDVKGNFLCESHFYRGFYYLMRHTDVEPARSLRESLFPSLSLALEAVLHQIVADQMEKARKAAQTGVISEQRRSSLRVPGGGSLGREAVTQSQQMPVPNFQTAEHPVIMLAKQLKTQAEKRKAKSLHRTGTQCGL